MLNGSCISKTWTRLFLKKKCSWTKWVYRDNKRGIWTNKVREFRLRIQHILKFNFGAFTNCCTFVYRLNTTSATCRARSVFLSRAPVITLGFDGAIVAQSSNFYVLFYKVVFLLFVFVFCHVVVKISSTKEFKDLFRCLFLFLVLLGKQRLHKYLIKMNVTSITSFI